MSTGRLSKSTVKGFIGYIRTDTPFFSLSPVTKLAVTLILSAIVLLIDDPRPLLVCLIFTLVLILLAKAPIKAMKLYTIGVLWMSCMCIFFNVIFRQSGDVVFQYGLLRVTTEGTIRGASILLKLLSMAYLTIFFVTSLRDRDIVYGLYTLRVPYSMIFVAALTFRSWGLFQTDLDTIRDAMTSRGLDFNKGNAFARAKKFVSVLVPLISILVKRIDDITKSVETRAFGSGIQRTYYHNIGLEHIDYAIIVGCFAALILTGILRYYYGLLSFSPYGL